MSHPATSLSFPHLLAILGVLIAPPMACNTGGDDDDACNSEGCRADADGDGYFNFDIDELQDCDDNNADIHPEADEVCDGNDTDCNGVPDDVDIDEDGFISDSCGGPDCDDGNAEVFPGNPESCDFADNDCDDQIDEGFDADDDGWTFCAGDCRDSDPFVNPDAIEACDGLDNNCDNHVDEAFDTDDDGYIDVDDPDCALIYGPGGQQAELGDCDDTNEDIRPGVHEYTNDAIDNDCDGRIDEGEDDDGDSYDNCAPGDPGAGASCTHAPGGDDGLPADCADSGDLQSAVQYPGATFQVPNSEGFLVYWPEICDSVDNDCNGQVDEGYDPKTCNATF